MRLLLIGVLALAGSILLAAWQVPARLDWNRYRATVEAVASASLGRPVAIAGRISLVLLPEPQLNADEVVIGSWNTGTDTDATGRAAPPLRVTSLRLRVAPLPLLLGRVDTRELVLRGPDLVVAWPLAPGELAAWPPSWLEAFSARIEDGRLHIGEIQFTGVNAVLTTSGGIPAAGASPDLDPDGGGIPADPGTGTLHAVGTAELAGHRLRFSARLASGGPQLSSRLNIALAGEGGLDGSSASFAGQVAATGMLTGQLVATGADASKLLAAPALAFKAGSQVASAGTGFVFSDIDATFGGTVVRGAGRLGPGQAGITRLDLSLAAVRVDLAPWLDLSPRIGAAPLPIGLKLTAEAAELGGGNLRQLRLDLELGAATVKIIQATALLPGEAALRMSGDVQAGIFPVGEAARPTFAGDARLEAPALRATLQWLDDAGLRLLPALPAGVLEHAAFRAHVEAGAGSLTLTGIDGQVDGGAIAGELRLRPAGRAEAHPAVAASLDLAVLVLDPWRPESLTLASLIPDLTKLGGGFDVDVKLRARLASLASETIGPMLLDAALQPMAGGDARLILRRLEVRPRGIDIVASGNLGPGARVLDARIDATAVDIAELADLIPAARRPAADFWRGPASASLRLAGPAEALAGRLTLDLADARLEASPLIDLRTGGWSGPATLRHPSASRLMALFGMTSADRWLGEGSLSVIAQVAGVQPPAGAFRLVAENLDIVAGLSRLSAPFALEFGPMPILSARINADSLALPGVARENLLPVAWLQDWQGNVAISARETLADLRPVLGPSSATLSLAGGVLRLAPFTGQLGGGTLAGTMTLDTATQLPALTLDATLRDVRIAGPMTGLKLDLAGGLAAGTMRLSGSGYSAATLLSTMQGNVMLDIEDGVLTGFDLFRVKLLAGRADPRRRAATEAALHDALSGGPTAFQLLTLRGTAAAGTLTFHDTRLSGPAGEVDFTGNVSASALDLRAALRPAIEDPPEIVLRLTGTLDDPRRSLEFSTFLRWLAAHPRP